MYPAPHKLQLPIVPYEVTGRGFREHLRRHVILWATHLGEDIVAPAGTPVQAIGEGKVLWSEMRLGSVEKRNWGGLVIIAHTHATTKQPFYSVYGHLHQLAVAVGDVVQSGQRIGEVAPALTPKNGWWKTPHLHFGIYTGPWNNQVLPGYWRPERWYVTKVRHWHAPTAFISAYPAV